MAVIPGNGTSENLPGASEDDIILGRGGNDTLSGGLGRDSLVGGGGDDHLVGGSGIDTLVGGPGADTFWLRSNSDSDVIEDLRNNDSVRIESSRPNPQGDSVGESFFNRLTGELYYDPDGRSGAIAPELLATVVSASRTRLRARDLKIFVSDGTTGSTLRRVPVTLVRSSFELTSSSSDFVNSSNNLGLPALTPQPFTL